jgi:hypothetical protein
VNETVEELTTSVNETVEGLPPAVNETVEGLTTSVNETVEGVTTSVNETVEAVTTSVNETVEGVATAVADRTEGLNALIGEPADPVVTGPVDTVAETTSAVEEAVSPVVQPGGPPSPVTDGVTQPADEIIKVVDVPGVGPFAGPEESALVPVPDFDMAGTGEAATANLPPSIELGAFPVPNIPLDDLAAALPVVGAIGIATVGAAAIARGACSPAGSVVFTNVRLIPCFAEDTVRRITTTVAGSALSGTTGSSASAAVTSRASGLGFGFGLEFGQKIREGFDRVVQPAVDDEGETLTDSRLLMQLGMLLGMAYLAFLTVWFWATRIRWNPRTRM